jgi:poly(A) polymerase
MTSSPVFPDSSLLRAARAVVATIQDSGHQACYVGGCVRDAFLRRPIHDVDIATSMPVDEVINLFDKTVAVGAQFGVVLVIYGEFTFEVATFRRDGEYKDGRHPTTVAGGTQKEDAERRDFTINALFYDPIAGELVDSEQGRSDIEARVLRCVGDADRRFREDALRLLRACRFAGMLGFTIEDETWQAMYRNSKTITRVSAERIREELEKMLLGGRAGACFELLFDARLLKRILPEVAAMKGTRQPPEFHPEGDVWTHTMMMIDDLPVDASSELAFAALLHDVGKPMTITHEDRIRFNHHPAVGAQATEDICRRLHFSKRSMEKIVDLVRTHMRFMHVKEMRPAKLKRMLAHDHFSDMLALHKLDCCASHGKLDNHDFCAEALKGMAPEELDPEPLITGHDLIAEGFDPGRKMGSVLEYIKIEQLEGRVGTKDQALAEAKKKWAE